MTQTKEEALNELHQKIEETKKILPKEVFNKNVFSELESFAKLRQTTEQRLKELREKLEENRNNLIKEVEAITSTFKGEVDVIREKIEAQVLTIGDGSQTQKVDQAIQELQQTLRAIPQPPPETEEEESKEGEKEKEELRLAQEIAAHRDKLSELQAEKKEIEDTIKQLKKELRTQEEQFGQQEQLEKFEQIRYNNELERTRKQLVEEEAERKVLEKELLEMKEKVKEAEEAAAATKEGEASEGTTSSSSAIEISSAPSLSSTSSPHLSLSSLTLSASPTLSSPISPRPGRGMTSFLSEKELQINWYDIRIIKRIGGGGFAEVYEGVLHGERVAIKKLISQSWDQEGRKELEKEVAVMINSHSSYIVTLYGFNLYPPHMCMVMEFFPRGSLAYILWDKNIQLPWEKRWRFAHDAALALNYLHSRNPPILHRDIKAGNYLVSSDWKLKLTDFGCSIFKGMEEQKDPVAQSETSASSGGGGENFIGGTFQWTAPEVLSGETYTERADVYSYAMVMFEIANRKQPWDEYQAPDEQYRVRQWVGEGRRPQLNSDVPDDYKKIVESAWEGDANKRVTMASLIRVFARKSFLFESGDGEEAEGEPGGHNWVEEKARLVEEIEQLKKVKESSEKKLLDCQNKTEKEKRMIGDIEQRVMELEAKLEGEKNSVKSLEKLVSELDKRLKLEKEKVLDLEKKTQENDKKFNLEKKKSEKLNKEKDDAELELEEITKKHELEKKKRMELQRELIQHGVVL